MVCTTASLRILSDTCLQNYLKGKSWLCRINPKQLQIMCLNSALFIPFSPLQSLPQKLTWNPWQLKRLVLYLQPINLALLGNVTLR